MTLIPPQDERALPVLAGAVLALAYPPAALLVPAFVGLVPLLVFLDDRPPGPRGRWAATRAGLVAGAVYFSLQLYWLAVALTYYSPLAVPAYLGVVIVAALMTGGFGWAVHYTRDRLGLPVAAAAVLFWTALEWVQGHLGDLAFPWLGLGTSLAPFPALAGAADLVGSRGLTVWVVAVNGLVATTFLRYRSGRRTRRVVAALAVLVLVPAAYGLIRQGSIETRPSARVALVQPDIPEELKLDRAVALDTSLSALTRLTRQLGRATDGVDLVVWPEVALPVELGADGPLADRVRRLAREVGAPILVGAYGTRPGEPGRAPVGGTADRARTRFNSAFLVDGGGVEERYDKRRLVPFVERVPFIDPTWLQGDLPRYFGALGRGTRPSLFSTDRARFGTLICYESIFGGLSADYRRAGADFLVNMTNDAWFGREAWYARTTALWQHPAHMVLRAIENRVGVARAANTGISMYIDPLGRRYRRTALFEAAVRVDTVYTTDERTLFTRWGDWLATLVTALAGAALLLARIRVAPPASGALSASAHGASGATGGS